MPHGLPYLYLTCADLFSMQIDQMPVRPQPISNSGSIGAFWNLYRSISIYRVLHFWLDSIISRNVYFEDLVSRLSKSSCDIYVAEFRPVSQNFPFKSLSLSYPLMSSLRSLISWTHLGAIRLELLHGTVTAGRELFSGLQNCCRMFGDT